MIGKKCKCHKEQEHSKKTTKDRPFPEKELREWLKNRTFWNHDDWLMLLKMLEEKGYSQWTSSEEGRTRLGHFLESERNKPL